MVYSQPILRVIGVLLTVLSVTMVIPALADAHYNNPDWKAFIISAFFTCFTGISLVFTNQTKNMHMTLKATFFLTTFSWIALTAFAALPFLFSELRLSYTDAFFESMSGLTTTGATILTDLESAPPGILLWRAILQWLGGIGIIVMAIAVLPMLKIGGMQLFRTESSDKSHKILPRATQLSGAISGTYVLLTVICMICLWSAGMTEFDALCHALTTVAIGGFSTHNESIGYYDSALIEMIIGCFLFLSALPFVLYIQLMRGKRVSFWGDAQVQLFVVLLLLSITAMTFWLHYAHDKPMLEALRYASFNTTSVMTTAGFASADYYSWGGFAITFLFLLSVVGGCTGSTTGGIKIFRFHILKQTAKIQIQRLIQPHGVFPSNYNGKPINEHVKSSVMSFFILFAFCFIILTILLSVVGLDFITSMSASASVLANLGPGMGDTIGPSGTYAPIPDIAKWFLTAGMLIGRLEIYTVLILFSPYFWRS